MNFEFISDFTEVTFSCSVFCFKFCKFAGPFGSCIKRWEMKKEIIQLHERFKQETIARPRLQNYSVYVSQREKKTKAIHMCMNNTVRNMKYIQEHERNLESI